MSSRTLAMLKIKSCKDKRCWRCWPLWQVLD